MAEHYSGTDMIVNFGADSDSFASYGRTIEISEDAGAPDTIDTTHKGDTERQSIEGFPGAQETNVTLTGLDIYDSITAFGSVALNTKSTLVVYPAGQTHTYPVLTLQNARMHGRSQSVPYDGVTEMTFTFNAKNSLTRSTYSSA